MHLVLPHKKKELKILWLSIEFCSARRTPKMRPKAFEQAIYSVAYRKATAETLFLSTLI
jgi:hypothetical protein